MAVLGDGAGDEDWEGHDAGGVEGHEDEVRAGFRDDADEGSQNNHQSSIVADPVFYVNELQADAEDEEDAEGPCEDCQKVLPDDVVPEVFFDEVVGSQKEYEEDDCAEAGEEDIHPVFAKEVDVESFGFMDMGGVVVAEVAGGEGGDESGKADEHGNAFESVGAVRSSRAPTGRATMRRGGSGTVVVGCGFCGAA